MAVDLPVLETIKKTITTAAVLEVPAPIPSIPTGDTGAVAVGIGSVAVSIIGALLFLRRKIPHDSLEVAKDRIEGELLNKMMVERDAALKRADTANEKAIVDAGLIAGLQERNKFLAQELERVNKAMEKLELEFERVKSSIRSLNVESKKPIPTKSGEGPTTGY